MKKFFIGLLFLTGCKSTYYISETGYKNLFVKRATTISECPSSSGMAIDIYTDKDGSGNYSLGDSYESSMYACNGLDGVGKVTVFDFTNTSACKEVLAGKLWANKLLASSIAVRLYDGPVCSGNIVSTLKDDKDEVYFNFETLFLVQGMKLSVVEL